MGVEFGGFSAEVNWSYGSGLPFTRPLGFDSGFTFFEHLPDVKNEYGQPRILLDKPFTGRLPDFHRLDISVEQQFTLPVAQVSLRAGAVNAYDWNNIFYYDVYNQRGVDQLAFMPFVSLKMESL